MSILFMLSELNSTNISRIIYSSLNLSRFPLDLFSFGFTRLFFSFASFSCLSGTKLTTFHKLYLPACLLNVVRGAFFCFRI